MADFIYVDNSNLFIEAKRVSAVQSGMAMSIWDAHDHNVLDHGYKFDFGKLFQFLAGSDHTQVGRAVMFGSRPPPNDGVWQYARTAGFELVLEDRNKSNKEKKIDTGIVTEMMRDAYRTVDPTADSIILVSGDSDYVPTVNRLVADGYSVEVVFWGHASRELREACTKFVDLDGHLDTLRL